jgi:hypothetical protein
MPVPMLAVLGNGYGVSAKLPGNIRHVFQQLIVAQPSGSLSYFELHGAEKRLPLRSNV